MEHELKILYHYFKEILNGNKTFKLRVKDSNYKSGDTLMLLEFDNGTYTNEECRMKITYILTDAVKYALKEGFVILSINNLNKKHIDNPKAVITNKINP